MNSTEIAKLVDTFSILGAVEKDNDGQLVVYLDANYNAADVMAAWARSTRYEWKFDEGEDDDGQAVLYTCVFEMTRGGRPRKSGNGRKSPSSRRTNFWRRAPR